MLKAHASKRKYNFEEMKIEEIRKFDYEDRNRLRYAVHFQNKRGEGKFICRVVNDKNKKKVAVQRIE